MEELLKAVQVVLEWYAEDSSDNVARRAVMYKLREAYEAAQQSTQNQGGREAKVWEERFYKEISFCPMCGKKH